MTDSSPVNSIDAYRRYLRDQLCWIDGSPTCASSDSQRQCTSCRVKWSYIQTTLEFAIFEQFCNGERARKAAMSLGCSRNTVMSHYRTLMPEMEDLVARMLIEERIATTPQTVEEVIRLEKALRVGSIRKRGLACRFLFMNSLSPVERLEELFKATLAKKLQEKILMAKQARAFIDAQERRKAAGERESSKSVRKCFGGASIQLGTKRVNRPEARPSAPRRLVENIGKELWAFIAKHYPSSLPSPACQRLGDKWVGVWKECRKLIQSNRR
jgi:hypothetical protein